MTRQRQAAGCRRTRGRVSRKRQRIQSGKPPKTGSFALMPEMVPDMATAVIDLAFFPALALAIRPALWQGKQKVNRIFVPLLLLMALANLLVHLQALGVAQTAQRATDAMLYLTLLLITILAGRVMPFFTKAVLPDVEPKRWAWLEWISTLSMIGLIMLQLLYPQQTALSLLALVSAISLGLRVSGWHDLRIWHIPMLWILFLALLWIIIGLLLVALSHFAPALTNAATHALTIGGIGIMTLGMMPRVALGHTGRRLEPSRLTVLAFAILNLGTVVRVFGPLVLTQSYFFIIHLSGGLWILAFLLFCVVYLSANPAQAPDRWQTWLNTRSGQRQCEDLRMPTAKIRSAPCTAFKQLDLRRPKTALNGLCQ